MFFEVFQNERKRSGVSGLNKNWWVQPLLQKNCLVRLWVQIRYTVFTIIQW